MLRRLLRERGFSVGVLTLAAVSGSAITGYGNQDGDIHAKFFSSLPLKTLMQQILSSEYWLPGSVLAPRFFVPSSLPTASGTTSPGDDGSSPQCCAGCLGRNSISMAAAKVSPAVVNISNVSTVQSYFGLMVGKSVGCGTIIDPDGTILTCAHVVVDPQGPRTVSRRKVDVTLQDGRTFEGTVLNADFQSDIALVKIKSKTPLPTATFGSSSKLLPGDWVIALGCPLFLQNTVTAGIVSCVDRKSSDLGLGGARREYLQTDCSINEGNSGGPLVNLDGEVVGVNIMKVADAAGLSFAVPIDSVLKIIEHFKENGRVIRPWLGLKMLELNEMVIEQLKERDSSFPDVTRGVLVPVVTPGSPGEKAGFWPGDVVVEFDGKPVGSIKEITDLMENKVGVPIKVLVKRSRNQAKILTVVPEEAKPGY
ncbi:putative protease Do-like 14 isoform X2 [Wolffia australiana]